MDYDEVESGDVGLLTVWNPENSNHRSKQALSVKLKGLVKMSRRQDVADISQG